MKFFPQAEKDACFLGRVRLYYTASAPTRGVYGLPTRATTPKQQTQKETTQMKKTALLAVALATCLGYVPAQAAEVVSSNIVGYSKLTLKGNDGYTMIANPFVEVGTGDLIGIADMFADDTTNAKSGTSASAADNIKVWNGEGYETYWYRKPKSGDAVWVKGSTSETTDTIAPYTGFFYISRADEAAGDPEFFEVTIESPIAAE